MQTNASTHGTLLSRWTFRYVLTLFVGLLVIGVISSFWLRQSAIHERKASLQAFAQAAALQAAGERGSVVIPGDFYEWIDRTQRLYQIPGQFSLTVEDRGGSPLFVKSAPRAPSGENKVYTLSAPIRNGTGEIGTIAIGYDYGELAQINQNYTLIAALLGSAGVLGWLIIYFLSRHLRRPIMQLSSALGQIEAGNYEVVVPEHVREKEIHDLLVSFKAMAARLGTLEELRTELLAGVTHELKTPIASIHGLISAVRDGVATGEEAEEFLGISLEQTRRLQHMVTDLLDFNAFASGKINVCSDELDAGKLLGEIVYQWELLHHDEGLDLTVDLPDRSLGTFGDASRIQQIIVNLLNNSRQAFQGPGIIRVSLAAPSEQMLEILVADNGPGIPEAEQANIFERYYRGQSKQLTVGGLGLGLTYSRMLAAAMNGRLDLIHSSPEGTVFRLLLPRRQ